MDELLKAVTDNDFQAVDCPCCGNQTLDNYWICPICGWEYDGVVDDNHFSSANSSTLKDYRIIHWNMQ